MILWTDAYYENLIKEFLNIKVDLWGILYIIYSTENKEFPGTKWKLYKILYF